MIAYRDCMLEESEIHSDSKKMGIVITPSLNNYFMFKPAEGSFNFVADGCV